MFGWLLRLSDAARHRARLRAWNAEQAAGRRGEDLAHRYLERQGFTIVARNYRPASGHGEIDLVCWEREVLVFVEVKSRHTGEYGDPARNIDDDKLRALLRASSFYTRRAGVPWERVRFDLVSVLLRNPPSITHIRDAFRVSRTL